MCDLGRIGIVFIVILVNFLRRFGLGGFFIVVLEGNGVVFVFCIDWFLDVGCF